MMKRTLLLLYALLPFFGGECWAQVEKEKMVESDGFVWYKLSDKTTFQEGAESVSGQSLVPTGDYMVIYQTTSGGWFEVLAANAEGAYSKDGKCVVPISRGYDEVSYKAHQGFSLVKKNGKVGVCDKTGEEIIPCNYKNISYSSGGFKYEDAAGKWVPLGGILNGANSTSAKSNYNEYFYFIQYSEYKNGSIQEFMAMGEGMPEYSINIDLQSSPGNIIVTTKTNDVLNNRTVDTRMFEISPENSEFHSTSSGIAIFFYNDGQRKSIQLIKEKKFVYIADVVSDDGIIKDYKIYAPFDVFKSLYGDTDYAILRGILQGFNQNTNIGNHGEYHEQDIFDGKNFNVKFDELNQELRRYPWKIKNVN